MLNIVSSVVHYIFLAQSDLTVWTVCRQHTKHCVLWCAFIGARPKVVSCSPRELKNADPFIHNINDVCAKASQILTTSQWHTEASVRKNHWWQDKGWLCQAVHLKHFSRSHTVWVAIVVILLSVHPSVLVLCEYSKFRIESNSYLLFDSIRNWCSYSKFSNTYLTVISRAIDVRFVCTLPATSYPTHLSVEPSAAPHVFLPLPLPWVPWPRTARTRGGSSRACRACSQHQPRPWHLMAL